MSVPKVTSPSEKVQAAPRAGVAMAVIMACALAWNEPSIIAFRVLQGVGGAFIMANSGAVIADLYPRELRGKAYGYTSVGWTTGAIIGIVLGGVIVTISLGGGSSGSTCRSAWPRWRWRPGCCTSGPNGPGGGSTYPG
ncbi:MAG: MFS transporter [Streptosporangiaceae bacterium]